MAQNEERITKVETTLAHLKGGAVVLSVIVLGFMGFASWYQVPNAVKEAIPKAVSAEIDRRFPEIEKEIEENLISIRKSEEKARQAASTLTELSQSYHEKLSLLERDIATHGIYVLGDVHCGKKKTLSVPIHGTTTDNWIVFGINPKINAEERARFGDNALYSHEISVLPNNDRKSWTIDFNIRINYNTKNERPTIADCNWDQLKSRTQVQVVAIKKRTPQKPAD